MFSIEIMSEQMNELVERIADVVRICGDIILNANRSDSFVSSKEGHGNFVTVYDKKVQTELQTRLSSILPEAAFVGEEEDIHEDIHEGYAFVVDPIDGTANFVRDFKGSVISVGLLKDGEPYIGVVYNPYLDEMFTAKKGKGAYLNGRKIHVSDHSLSEGLVLFGTAPYYKELNDLAFKMAHHYFKQALDLRRTGTAALDLCIIAAGRAELYFELILQPWDYAAGSVILTEAGGKIEALDGSKMVFDKPCSCLATNGCEVIPYDYEEIKIALDKVVYL